MLPLDYQGSLDLPAAIDTRDLITRLAQSFREVDARDVQLADRSLSFRGGMFRFAGRSNVLNTFGSGLVVIDDARRAVRYELNLSQFVGTMGLLVAVGAGMAGFATGEIAFGVFVLVFGFLWLVGLNVAIGIWRFRRFLGKVIGACG